MDFPEAEVSSVKIQILKSAYLQNFIFPYYLKNSLLEVFSWLGHIPLLIDSYMDFF